MTSPLNFRGKHFAPVAKPRGILLNKTYAMKNTVRTFISINIELQKKKLNNLKDLKKEFHNEDIKWVAQENLHLTLRFLGETTLVQVEEIKTALFEVTKSFSPFQLNLLRLDYFKRDGKPKVLIVHIKETKTLNELAKSIYHQVEKVRFGKENRSYQPHLTLGRIKSIKDINLFYDVVDKYSQRLYQTIDVKEFTFYQSLLSPSGPVYKSIQNFKFANS